MTHTPGPWKWRFGSSSCLCEEGIVSEEGVDVFVNCGRNAGDPTEEDKRLLIAAPEMYEALREIARVHHCTAEQFKIHAQELASAAIKKAEGAANVNA